MDWKDALTALANVAPKLAFKPELVEQLRAHAQLPVPPPILMTQMEVMLSVAKQNQRVAQQHGYAGLEEYANRVEAAVQNVLIALKNTGVAPTKSQQAGAI